MQHRGQVIPLEVKAEENLNAKKLKSFVNTYQFAFGVRTSMSDYRDQEKLINLLLYTISLLCDICEQGRAGAVWLLLLQPENFGRSLLGASRIFYENILPK